MEAEAALKSLKMKMANAPKPKSNPKYNVKVNKNYTGYPGSNMNQINQMGMGGGYGNQGGYGGGYDAYDDMNLGMNDNYGGGMGGNYGGMSNNYDGGMPNNYGGGMQNNYGGGMGGNKPGYSGNNKLKAAKPSTTNKKTGGVRKGLGPMNPNFGGGMARAPFGGMGGGGGGVDSRPIGGGMTEDMMPDEDEPTSPCPHCGRNFRQSVLPKHTKICQKVFQKKRKAFNMTKQRMGDPEQASLMKQGQMEAKRNPMMNKKNKGGIPKWKLQSMEFRAICNPGKANQIRAQMGLGGKVGGSKAPMKGGINKGGFKGGKNAGYGGNDMDMYGGGYTPSVIANDYTHCQYCNRNYNEEAYNKHLPGCKRRYEEAQFRNKMSKKPSGKTAPMRGGYGANKYGGGKFKK